MLDAGLEKAVDRLEEVLAVVARVETEDRAAEQALEDLGAPRADAERLGVRPWNVPERDDGGARQPLAHHPRQQREVVVLDQHDRIVGLRFVRHRIGEALVDAAVLPPVLVAEHRPDMGDVAQRPQAFVRETIVVAALLRLGQPDRGAACSSVRPAERERSRASRRPRGRPSRCRGRSTSRSRRASPVPPP